MRAMDLREAKACLDEYTVSINATCRMIKPDVADGELREAIGKYNDSLIGMLNVHLREATILSILVLRQLNARLEQMLDFPDGRNDAAIALVKVALNELDLARNNAIKVRAEYDRKAATSKVAEDPNPEGLAITEFLQKREKEERDRRERMKKAN